MSGDVSDDKSPLPMRFGYGQRWNEASGKLDSPQSKGIGFYGPLEIAPGNIASEYSGDSEIGQYPNVAPGMTPQQIGTVLMAARMEQPVPRSEAQFAENAARQRIAQGKSPFFDQRVDPYPKWSPDQHWQEPAIMPKGKY